jgi:hypothetical protein
MNIPDHISENIEIILWVKILKLFDADPGSGIFLTLDPRSGMEKLGTHFATALGSIPASSDTEKVAEKALLSTV